MNKGIKRLLIILACIGMHRTHAANYINPDTTYKHGADTLYQINIDTLNDRSIQSPYAQQPEAIKAFTPYFVKNIIAPGDTNNASYQQYAIKANHQIAQVKAELFKRISTYPKICAVFRLSNPAQLDECGLAMLPVYDLTHNIALYDGKQPIASYFNLDTAQTTYTLIKNNTVLGIIKYSRQQVSTRRFTTADSIAYCNIISMHKKPALYVATLLSDDRPSNDYKPLGYLSNGHVIFAEYAQGNYIIKRGGGLPDEPMYMKKWRLYSAETYYLGTAINAKGQSYMPALPRIIEQEMNRIHSQQKITQH